MGTCWPLNPSHRALNPAKLQLNPGGDGQRYKEHSLLQCHLPVQLLCHRRPRDVPLEELRVHTPQDELSPVLIGGLAAKKTRVTEAEIRKSV